MKFFERNEMMRYLTRPATPKTLPRDTSGEELGTREGFKDGTFATGFEHKSFLPLTKEQREIAKKVYNLKESEVDDWQTNPANKAKKKNITRGVTTLETKATNLDPNRIIVSTPRGSDKVNDVIFPDEKIEKNFLKDLKERFTLSQGQSEKNIKYFSENYPIGEGQVKRAINYFKKKLNLKYSEPLTKPEVREKLKKVREVTSDIPTEDYITKKIKQPILKEQDLVKKIDLAHRVSKQHMKYLGLQFNTRTTGFDSRLINQVIIKPSEIALEKFYKKQRKLVNEIKKNGITDELSEQLKNINNEIRTEAKKTSGRLMGVTVDPETLEPYFEGKKAKFGLTDKILDIKEIAEMPYNKKVKFLANQIPQRIQTEIDRGFIPNDFNQILSDSKKQESILKYADKFAPELKNDLKEIFKNPTSTKSLKLYSGFAMLEDIAEPALKRLEPFFKAGLDFAKTAVKSPLAKGVGKFGLGEVAVAPLFSALDYGAGLEPSEIALNIPTLGLGTTAKDYGTAVLNLPKKQQERLGEIFSQETTLPEVDEDIVKNISKTYEDLEKKREKVAESRIQPLGSFEEPFIPLGPLINKQEVKDDLYIPSLPKKNLVEREGVLNLAFGGRVGFKDGPKDPSKRKFIKGAGITGAAIGILNLAPDLFKALKKTKTAVKLLPKAAGMPEWFNPLVAKIMKEGVDISPKATRVEDIIKVKKLEIKSPDGKGTDTIVMTEYPNGTIEVDAEVLGGGAFDSPFTLTYKPPKSDINLETGKEIKDPGSFYVVEQRPKPDYNDPGNFEIDYETMYVDDAISDIERIEKIATGKIISPQKVEQRAGARKFVESNPSEDIVNRYGDSEIEYDRMKDEGLLDD